MKYLRTRQSGSRQLRGGAAHTRLSGPVSTWNAPTAGKSLPAFRGQNFQKNSGRAVRVWPGS